MFWKPAVSPQDNATRKTHRPETGLLMYANGTGRLHHRPALKTGRNRHEKAEQGPQLELCLEEVDGRV